MPRDEPPYFPTGLKPASKPMKTRMTRSQTRARCCRQWLKLGLLQPVESATQQYLYQLPRVLPEGLERDLSPLLKQTRSSANDLAPTRPRKSQAGCVVRRSNPRMTVLGIPPNGRFWSALASGGSIDPYHHHRLRVR